MAETRTIKRIDARNVNDGTIHRRKSECTVVDSILWRNVKKRSKERGSAKRVKKMETAMLTASVPHLNKPTLRRKVRSQRGVAVPNLIRYGRSIIPCSGKIKNEDTMNDTRRQMVLSAIVGRDC
jgi:hypothetical protein